MKTFKLQAVGLGLIASIAVVLMCMLCPAKAMAEEAVAYSVGDDGNDVFYDNFQSAINGGYNGKTIVMVKNWSIDAEINIGESQQITIDMNGYTINANKKSCVFYLANNSSLTLTASSDVSYEHIVTGFSNVDGGEVHSAIFTGGVVTGGWSGTSSKERGTGGIYMESGSTLTLDNVAVAGNGTCSNGSKYGAGGVRMGDNCKISMINGASVRNNMGHTGGISINGENTEISMNNSSINNNYVIKESDWSGRGGEGPDEGDERCGGGGITSWMEEIKIFMENGSKINENAGSYGGGIAFNEGHFYLISNDRTAEVKGNYARGLDGYAIDKEFGGGICSYYRTEGSSLPQEGEITGINICDNVSEDGGGGLYLDERSTTVADCVITGNTCKSNQGGGVTSNAKYNSFIRCIISGNSSAENGGGINIYATDNKIEDCTITGNWCNTAGKNYEGGGVYVNPTDNIELKGKVVIAGNTRGKDGSADDLFLGDGTLWLHAYITGGVSAGSYVGIRTGMSDDQMVGENITTYTPGTYFMDLGGYYITKGTDHGGDLWQRHGDHKFAVMLQGKSIGDYYPGETVTVDGSTGNAYLVFSQWLEDESSGLFPFVDYVEDKANSTLTFTMPQNDVNLWHSLKILPPDKPAPRPAPSPTV